MEDTIVQQNHAIMTLKEDLEEKCQIIKILEEDKKQNLRIFEDQIKKRDQKLIDLEGELQESTKSIKLLQEELNIKNKSVLSLQDDISKNNLLIEEVEKLRYQSQSLNKKITTLEEELIEKNETIKRSSQWHFEIKKEFEALGAAAIKKETELKLEHEKEIEKLKQDFIEQFKLLEEKKSLLEVFLENQVNILLNKAEELSNVSGSNQEEVQSYRRIYEEEIKNIKLTVNQFSDKSDTLTFMRQVEDLSKKLMAPFLHQNAIKGELSSKIEELNDVKNELSHCKRICDEVMSSEKQLYKKLAQTELEKAQLQQRLLEANSNYEKVTIDFNCDRMELEKKYRQVNESYETDIIILNKSLQELLGNIPSNLEFGSSLSNSGDSSMVSIGSDINAQFSNSSVFNAQKIVTKCINELKKLCNEARRISQENKALKLAIDLKGKMFDEKVAQLKKLTDDINFIKSKYSSIEEDKKYAENKLQYIIEEKNSIELKNKFLSSQVSELNNQLKKYEEEINCLTKNINEIKNINDNFNKSNLDINIQQRIRMHVGSDSELIGKPDFQTSDVSFESLPGNISRDVNIYTSTPFREVDFDLQGGGEFAHQKPLSNIQNSLMKWMDQCQKLHNENQSLKNRIEDLELLNEELKFSMTSIKNEMIAFEGKQQNLERKMNNFVSLKKQYIASCDEVSLREITIQELLKEVNDLKSMNNELFNQNLKLEEMSKKAVLELTEIKHFQNISLFTDTLTHAFNEKVAEIIDLKKEIQSLKNEKMSLSQKINLLHESNNTYIVKLNSMFETLCLCQEELENTNNDKSDITCNNKLLTKEVELLQMRVDYLSNLRDTHWCNPSSMKLIEELQEEVLNLYRSSVELRFDVANSAGNKTPEKDNHKLNPLDLPEILKVLSVQLRDEQVDFEKKIAEFHQLTSNIKDDKTIDDAWIVKIDKALRNILEEMKYHKEQHYRIEEALRSTGKFHDELQKQKDALRVKDYEMDSIQKKLEEEKMKSMKSEGHLKILENEILEKNDHIKLLIDQKEKFEQDVIKLKKDIGDLEIKLEGNKKAIEWKSKLEELQKSKGEINEKINNINKAKYECECKENFARGLEEAEISYRKAVDEVKALFEAELTNSLLQIQEEHKEQVEKLNCIISEQAVRIGFLSKKVAGNDNSVENDIPNTNQDMTKQFELSVYALQELHQEELQLLKLQLEAEKYNGIHQPFNKMTKVSNEGNERISSSSCKATEKSLLQKLESVLTNDFVTKLKKFLHGWHDVFNSRIPQIEEYLSSKITDCLQLKVEQKVNDDKEKHDDVDFDEFFKNMESARRFLQDAEEMQAKICDKIQQFVNLYSEITSECFTKIKEMYSSINENLQYKDKYLALIEEKEHLEKQYKNALELLHMDHKADEDKLNLILNEIKHCCENGCDPNTLLKIQEDLEEKHKKELEDLRVYYVQMCANMEKQYSEDVNSLHSRMLSLSSSCSDEILSDQLAYDKATSEDHPMDIMLSDVLPHSVDILENLSPEQLKLLEKINHKWSEDIKLMKKELEKKYTNKIEQLQDRISTFIYNNELDVSVRCIKDEVMRDCSQEIQKLEDDISKTMTQYEQSFEMEKYNDEFDNKDINHCKCSCHKNDSLSEQLMVDIIGNISTDITIDKPSKTLLLDGIKATLNLQEDNFLKVADLYDHMNNTLSIMEHKVKDKESQLLCLQNKLNNFSQVILSLNTKCKELNEKSKWEAEVLNDSAILDKMLADDCDDALLPPEILKLSKVFKNKLVQAMAAEREKHASEIENLKDNFKQEKLQLEGSLKNCTPPRHTTEELEKLIKERDCLKQMTLTLKSAVTQLVSYLNTCEDELNKTVVDELLKICDETPKKSGYNDLNNAPAFKRVHFAPEVEISDLDESVDLSTILRLQLDSCLSKLKLEAASLLGLTALQPPPANLNKQIENLHKENEELLEEIVQLKHRLDKKHNESLELKEQLFSDDIKENGSTILQDKVQLILSNGEQVHPESVKLLEDLAKFGDQIINELQHERVDLQQQIDAADKQLKSTRKFLEEQAFERESERDEYSKQVSDLEKQLKECGKSWSSHHNMTSQVKELEVELKETTKLLEETGKKKDMLDEELKDAIDKIWVLRDIISGLEAELKSKSDKEAALEKKLDDLENELDMQSGTQFAMAQELESLRSQSMDEGYLEQIKQLQENIKVQFNSNVVRQMKSQLQDMSKAIEQRTKDLEALYLTSSCTSLSSPSEEVSLREQLELSRSKTPDLCPSPVNLPVEEITRLQDKIARHGRAEEVLIKRFRDIQITTAKLSSELEEMHSEREIMQLQLKKQKVQLAESNNKIDDLRHKVETAHAEANKDLISQVQELKEKYSMAEQALDSLQNQLIEQKGQLMHAEEIISKQQFEIRSLAESDSDIVDSVRLELAAVTAERNKLQEELDKSKRDFNMDVMGALLADKNEDIDQLQETVAMLKSQECEDKTSSCNSKGFRVSFAADVEESSIISDDMRLRDAPRSNSLEIITEDIQVFGRLNSSGDSDENLMNPTHKKAMLSPFLSQESTTLQENNEMLIKDLQLQLNEKLNEIKSLENEVKYLKSIEIDLANTKSELEAVLSSVSDDKQFYESQLQSLKENISNKDQEITRLKNTIFSKDTELIKTTADVEALREISFSLQAKLTEATKLVEDENVSLKEELAQLKSQVNERDDLINNLRKEIFAHQNNLSDEKELCNTLKSSLNFATQEKLNIEENLEALKVENSNILNALHTAEKNFNEYVSHIEKLKNELHSLNYSFSFDGPSDESSENVSIKVPGLFELKQYIMKLLRSYENMHEDRDMLLREVDDLKSKIATNDAECKDFTINKLQDELKDLKSHVMAIKEEKLQVFSNYSSEINELHNDIHVLQSVKQVLTEKLSKETAEKLSLKDMLEKLKREYNEEKEQMQTKNQPLSSKLEKLSICLVDLLDIPPVSYAPGLDDLAERMRNEIQVSATLDNCLLDSILPDNGALRNCNVQQGSVNSLDHSDCGLKMRSLEKALMEEIDKVRGIKSLLRQKENQYRELETGNCQLKLQNDHLGRLISSHNDKMSQLMQLVDSQKERIITLELSLLKEQTSAKQVFNCLEEERRKGRESQKEDITLIENMRKRLQSLMENEIKLKKMIIEERQKNENLTAQLNSLQAMEKYRSDSDDETKKNVQKRILREREKYLSMKVEYEKERRTCEDLREVLSRERRALCLQRERLSKSDSIRKELEHELSILKKRLNEENLKRQIAEFKTVKVQQSADEILQKERHEHENKKSLEAAYSLIHDLEKECHALKRYVQLQEEGDEDWKLNIHVPLIQQLNEVNKKLEELLAERLDLKSTLERLEEENSRLRNQVSQLRLASIENDNAASRNPSPCNLRHFDSVAPVIEMEMAGLMKRIFEVESRYKALQYQKRYLLVSLQAYKRAHSETALTLLGHYRLKTRRKFRAIALAVVAAIKIRSLPFKRLIRYNKKKDILLNTLNITLFQSTNRTREAGAHSPPSRDRPYLR